MSHKVLKRSDSVELSQACIEAIHSFLSYNDALVASMVSNGWNLVYWNYRYSEYYNCYNRGGFTREDFMQRYYRECLFKRLIQIYEYNNSLCTQFIACTTKTQREHYNMVCDEICQRSIVLNSLRTSPLLRMYSGLAQFVEYLWHFTDKDDLRTPLFVQKLQKLDEKGRTAVSAVVGLYPNNFTMNYCPIVFHTEENGRMVTVIYEMNGERIPILVSQGKTSVVDEVQAKILSFKLFGFYDGSSSVLFVIQLLIPLSTSKTKRALEFATINLTA